MSSLRRSGQDRLNALLGELMGRRSVQKALERAILHAYDTKARFDRSVAGALRAMNIPTRRDMRKLQAEVRALRADLERLSSRRAPRARASRRSGPRPPRGSGGKR